MLMYALLLLFPVILPAPFCPDSFGIIAGNVVRDLPVIASRWPAPFCPDSFRSIAVNEVKNLPVIAILQLYKTH